MELCRDSVSGQWYARCDDPLYDPPGDEQEGPRHRSHGIIDGAYRWTLDGYLGKGLGKEFGTYGPHSSTTQSLEEEGERAARQSIGPHHLHRRPEEILLNRLSSMSTPWLVLVGDSNFRSHWRGIIYRMTALPNVLAMHVAPTAQARHHPKEKRDGVIESRNEAWYDRDALLEVRGDTKPPPAGGASTAGGGTRIVRISLRFVTGDIGDHLSRLSSTSSWGTIRQCNPDLEGTVSCQGESFRLRARESEEMWSDAWNRLNGWGGDPGLVVYTHGLWTVEASVIDKPVSSSNKATTTKGGYSRGYCSDKRWELMGRSLHRYRNRGITVAWVTNPWITEHGGFTVEHTRADAACTRAAAHAHGIPLIDIFTWLEAEESRQEGMEDYHYVAGGHQFILESTARLVQHFNAVVVI